MLLFMLMMVLSTLNVIKLQWTCGLHFDLQLFNFLLETLKLSNLTTQVTVALLIKNSIGVFMYPFLTIIFVLVHSNLIYCLLCFKQVWWWVAKFSFYLFIVSIFI